MVLVSLIGRALKVCRPNPGSEGSLFTRGVQIRLPQHRQQHRHAGRRARVAASRPVGGIIDDRAAAPGAAAGRRVSQGNARAGCSDEVVGNGPAIRRFGGRLGLADHDRPAKPVTSTQRLVALGGCKGAGGDRGGRAGRKRPSAETTLMRPTPTSRLSSSPRQARTPPRPIGRYSQASALRTPITCHSCRRRELVPWIGRRRLGWGYRPGVDRRHDEER